METRTCQNCKSSFVIEKEDFNFYEKIKVPPPTLCPECRQQRRYAFRNERILYKRKCDLCAKNIVTFYSPNKPHKVYCIECWWSDKWDPNSYGKDFDFSKPFFEQFRELQLLVPRIAVFNRGGINSEFTNHSGDNKNCYISSCCFFGEDVFYSNWIMHSKNCIDCTYIYSEGEKLYECVDSRKSFKSQFCFLIENCIDCMYCYDCRNCNDCFMSSNLRNKKYVFNNIQLSKEEYFDKLSKLNLDSNNERKNLLKDFYKMLKNKAIHKYVIDERNINSTGSTIFNSKNAKNCFDVEQVEDVKYVVSAVGVKTSMDLYHIGWKTELLYEAHGGEGYYNCKFCHHSAYSRNTEYSDSCNACEDVFGCISVKKGKYMILNKKYSEKEYKDLKEKIIEHMKKNGEYGEFFPPSISPICYNESAGIYYLPLSKEEVLSRGWQWEDDIPGTYDKENISMDSLEDSIKDTKDDIIFNILKCEDCNRNYNIVQNELTFYRNENIPIPRKCSECRYKRRFDLRLPRKLYKRKCMKEGCLNKFETPYSPDRPEKIYCEECYKKEIY